MIIDAHAHIFPDGVAAKAIKTILDNASGNLEVFTNGTFDSLLSSMDEAGVDYSVALPVATSPGHWSSILQWIKTVMPRSERIIYFGTLHPDDDYKAVIKEFKNEGLQGIKFHPGYQNFPADSKEAYKVYEEALDKGLVLQFHSGYDPSLPQCDYTSVERFARLVRDFSNSKIILAHGGGMDEWEKVADMLGGKGCYFDLAFVIEKMQVSSSARRFFRENEDFFVFGTDSPWRGQKEYVQLIKKSDTLTDEQREKLFCKNIMKLITIS